jgi:peroxiredoxin
MRNIMLIVLAFLIAVPVHAQMQGGITIGEVAPDVAVTPVGGELAALSAIQGDRVMLLVAFKTTCPYCQREVAHLNQVFAAVDATKVGVMMVSIKETPEAVARFKERFGVKYPLAIDTTGQMMRPYNIQGVPSFYVLDKARVARFQGHQDNANGFLNKVNAALGR